MTVYHSDSVMGIAFLCDQCFPQWTELTLGQVGLRYCDRCGRMVNCENEKYHFVRIRISKIEGFQ